MFLGVGLAQIFVILVFHLSLYENYPLKMTHPLSSGDLMGTVFIVLSGCVKSLDTMYYT